MTPSEIKAECERIWHNHDCRQPWHLCYWQMHFHPIDAQHDKPRGYFVARKGTRYSLKRKSQYTGRGVIYLTAEGYEYARQAYHRRDNPKQPISFDD